MRSLNGSNAERKMRLLQEFQSPKTPGKKVGTEELLTEEMHLLLRCSIPTPAGVPVVPLRERLFFPSCLLEIKAKSRTVTALVLIRGTPLAVKTDNAPHMVIRMVPAKLFRNDLCRCIASLEISRERFICLQRRGAMTICRQWTAMDF